MDSRELILTEYQIAKDSVKSVMTQIIAVSASLVTVALVLLQLLIQTSQGLYTSGLWYLALITVNFLAVFVAYQNIQVNALQEHIQVLESKLELSEVFRWETVIARVWYSTNPIAILMNICLLVPPMLILVFIYVGLFTTSSSQQLPLVVLAVNMVYLLAIASCYTVLVRRVRQRITNTESITDHEM